MKSVALYFSALWDRFHNAAITLLTLFIQEIAILLT